jgi:peptide-methionine (R)-S-oxide reductase
MPEVELTDEEWRQKLDPEQYSVLRQAATERAGTGELLHEHRSGLFRCAGCDNLLFRSDAKYDSGCGWPSFWEPISPDSVTEHRDRSLGMTRVEIRCGRCGGHLGHVFEDGPRPTGLRFCMNSLAMTFAPESDEKAGADAAPA